MKRIPIAAQCDATVLIIGETGTGKELVARAIHYQGARHGKPFIAINCGALPDHLFENEFFGHSKGAYTDANTAAKGLIAEAEGGTLFLDEIDTLSQAAQIKLLRFLQDREYRPLGSSSAITAEVRIIAATNADLAKKVESQVFRQDLYYRLKAFPIVVPPLRDRMEDVPLLTEHFIQLYSAQHKATKKRLSESALKKLLCYHWPGNVRELECTIQQAVLLSDSSIMHPKDLPIPDSSLSPNSDLRHPTSDLGPFPSAFQFQTSSLEGLKQDVVSWAERNFLVNILSEHNGNVTHAARAAGKQRKSFQRLLRKHGIERSIFAISTN